MTQVFLRHPRSLTIGKGQFSLCILKRYKLIIKKSLKISKGGNQNPYIEEQTIQWPKEKVLKDKLRSTKHTHKTPVINHK